MVSKKDAGREVQSEETPETRPVAIRQSWAGIQSAEELQRLLVERYGNIATGSELLGNEFHVSEKESLVGVPLTVLEFNFRESEDYQTTLDDGSIVNSEYAIVRCVRMDNLEMVVFADGGVGIYKQLKDFSQRTGQMGGIFCKDGLTQSDYKYTDPVTGEISKATTFYLGN